METVPAPIRGVRNSSEALNSAADKLSSIVPVSAAIAFGVIRSIIRALLNKVIYVS